MSTEKPSVTVADLDALISEYLNKEKERDEVADIVATKNKELFAIQMRLTNHLKELNREQYDSPLGKIEIKQKWRVNLPDGPDKMALFDHLKERGIFEQYATVNSNSLNALFMRDWEAAKERGEGMTFSMPGINPPTLQEITNVKPKKEKK